MITWTLSCIECCKTFYLENLDFPLNWSILNAIDSFVKIFYFFVFFTRQIRANFCRFFKFGHIWICFKNFYIFDHREERKNRQKLRKWRQIISSLVINFTKPVKSKLNGLLNGLTFLALNSQRWEDRFWDMRSLRILSLVASILG